MAVVEGRLDLLAGLDLINPANRNRWARWIASAEGVAPGSIESNGSTFGALRAAWAAISSTDTREPGHARRAIVAAVRAGHDTDTVAAITGALVGARYGVSGLPGSWRSQVHGWPGMREADLIGLAVNSAEAERSEASPREWLTARSLGI